jgi:hypothetical protein
MWLRNIFRVFPFRRVRDCILWWGGAAGASSWRRQHLGECVLWWSVLVLAWHTWNRSGSTCQGSHQLTPTLAQFLSVGTLMWARVVSSTRSLVQMLMSSPMPSPQSHCLSVTLITSIYDGRCFSFSFSWSRNSTYLVSFRRNFPFTHLAEDADKLVSCFC